MLYQFFIDPTQFLIYSYLFISVAVLAILFEGFNALSEDDLNFLTEYEEKEEEHDVDNGK